jgi:hypothetical protein
MNPQQLQHAISRDIRQALKSGETPPLAVFGILECAKLDLHANLIEMAKNQPANIVPANLMPGNGEKGTG